VLLLGVHIIIKLRISAIDELRLLFCPQRGSLLHSSIEARRSIVRQ